MIMKAINWETILSDIAEARDELQKIEAEVKAHKAPCVEELQARLQHVYRHVNFAWNCRHVSTARYAKMTDSEFKQWAAYPKGIETI